MKCTTVFMRHKSEASVLLAALLVTMAAPAFAQSARQAVKADPGEIVMTRNVAARVAYRQPLSPGVALLVSPKPNNQIDSALGLGTGEVSDSDAAALNASASAANGTAVGHALNGALAGMAGTHAPGNAGVSNSDVATGMRNTTGSIAGQVIGALGPLSTSLAAPAGGH